MKISSFSGVVFSRPLAAVLICLPLLAVAQAGKAFFSGPSIATTAQPVVLSGGGFVPDSALSVSVTRPDGAEAHHGAVAATDGTLSFRFLPLRPGLHVVKVLDSSGKTLVTASVAALP